MVDIHSHILFAVDDGAKSFEESREMLADAYTQGVRKMVATPHLSVHQLNSTKDRIKQNFKILEAFVREQYPDFQIYLGSEICYTYNIIEKIRNDEFILMGDSDYLLIEFEDKVEYKTIFNTARDIFLCGKIPILAHVERYDDLAFRSDKIGRLYDMGCIIQLDADSVLKGKMFCYDKYKRRAKFLLKNQYVHCIASDAHNMKIRRNAIRRAYKCVEEKYGVDIAKELFCKNPERILQNKLV